MPIYLKIGPVKQDGKKPLFPSEVRVDDQVAIKGGSTDSGHINWIPVNSCQYDQARKGPPALVKCQRAVDGTSVQLFNLSRRDDSSLGAIIDFVQTGDRNLVILRLKLAMVTVTAYGASGSGPGTMESFDLDCAGIAIEYFSVSDPDRDRFLDDLRRGWAF